MVGGDLKFFFFFFGRGGCDLKLFWTFCRIPVARGKTGRESKFHHGRFGNKNTV